MTRLKSCVYLSSIVVLANSSFMCYADGLMRTVAYSGFPVPGAEPGTHFASFRTPTLNDVGQSAFRATLHLAAGDVTQENDSGVWSEGMGTLRMVAREGMQAPGAPDGTIFDSFLQDDPGFPVDPLINNSGHIAFFNWLSQPDDTLDDDPRGVFSDRRGELELIAGPRELTADAGFIPSGGAHYVTFADGGHYATYSGIEGQTRGVQLVTSSAADNSIRSVVHSGMQAPGFPDEVIFGSLMDFTTGFLAMNNRGQMAFWADLRPKESGVDFLFRPFPTYVKESLWLETGGELQLIAQTGEQAPGAPNGAVFGSLGSNRMNVTSPVLNDAGQVAFSAMLKVGSGGITEYACLGIWLYSEGETRLIARGGIQAPGMPEGLVFTVLDPPTLNHRGEVVFNAVFKEVQGGIGFGRQVDQAIWASDVDGNLRLVARPGEQAPGMAAGDTFLSVAANAINGVGQVVLTGNVRSGSGIWAEDLSGNLRLVVREGQVLDVDDGPGVLLRQVASFRYYGYSGNEDGRHSGFNDRGQIAFVANFTDGTSGIFVSSVVTIPEPASFALCLVIAAMLVIRRRFR